MTSTLYRGGHVYSPADPHAAALLVDDGRLRWLGADADAPTADEVVDLDGAVVTPAFVDAHVHATDTGIALAGLDLSGARSAAEVLDAVAAFCASLPGDAVVVGHGWDESGWPMRRPPDALELDRAGAGRMVYLSQASIHSAACSTALLAAAPHVGTVPGYDASGWLRREAHHVVREIALGSINPVQRRHAQIVALRTAASYGIAAVHECGGPGTSDEHDFTGLLAQGGAANVLPEVYGYWGELMSAAKARELGAVGAGGDLYADGALGARTAHLRSSYLDGEDENSCGHAYVTADQVRDHLADCATHGMQGGFHAIGDAAIGTVLAGFQAAARIVGLDKLRAGRHRIEHAEIMDNILIKGFIAYGVIASMQPAFDRLWGGEHGMYAQRLGAARSLAANPIGAMAGVGVALAFGSDSPVTPLDPWGTVRAAMRHHNPAHRVSGRKAFAAHTRGGWRAVHDDDEGILALGSSATFAVWDAPAGLTDGLPTLTAPSPEDDEPPLPSCRRTVLRGTVIFDENDL